MIEVLKIMKSLKAIHFNNNLYTGEKTTREILGKISHHLQNIEEIALQI
jgi:hypothetical protein